MAANRMLEKAKQVVRQHYTPHFLEVLGMDATDSEESRSPGPPSEGAPAEDGMTVRQAAERYRTEIVTADGYDADHPTISNRIYEMDAHIVPQFGDREFAKLTDKEVQHWVNNLHVRKLVRPGVWELVPASPNYRKKLLRTLRALWRHIYGKKSCPFDETALQADMRRLRDRKRIKAGDAEEIIQERTKALNVKQVLRLLVEAMRDDIRVSSSNMRNVSVANTAALIALLIATGARIAELVDLRWENVHWAEGYITIGGTKTTHSLRHVPLQHTVLPWLKLLRELAMETGGAHPKRYVLFTDRRRPNVAANRNGLTGHVRSVLRRAGIKVTGRTLASVATHFGRNTFVSWGWGRTDLVSRDDLLIYAGHNPNVPDVHRLYLHTGVVTMPASHREFIRDLPSPTEVKAMLSGDAARRRA